METIYIYFFEILLIIQIYLMSLYKKTKDYKYWASFIEITSANLITSAGLFAIIFVTQNFDFLDDLFDIDIIILYSIKCFINNIIILIIGSIINKNNLKDESDHTSKTKNIGVIIILLYTIILIVIPLINNKISDASVHKKTITYLNEKYGDYGYKILDIERNYNTPCLFCIRNFNGYDVSVSSNNIKTEFNVYISSSITDTYTKTYYLEKINDFLSSKYDIKYEITLADWNKIPNTIGHMPTYDELIDLNIFDYNGGNLTVTKENYNYSEEKEIDYIKDISLDLIEYLNITKDFNMTFVSQRKKSRHNTKTYKSTINLSNDILTITTSSGEIYKFDINNPDKDI